MMSLPFAGESFDVLISGLALGHAPDVRQWMAECARVLARGGELVYSDIHPAAVEAGLSRSFKDADDRTCTVPHRCFEISEQENAMDASGLTLRSREEIRVGYELMESFSGSEEFYRRWRGLPIVLVMRALKP
jgi:malonyl-CoA O-methyltransferase